MGWGSGTSRLPYLVTPQEAIANISSNAAFFITDKFPSNVAVSSGDVAVVFISADSGENYITVEGNPGDRTSAGLNAWHNGDKLVKDAAAKFSKVVVVVHTVGPILMEEWIDLPSRSTTRVRTRGRRPPRPPQPRYRLARRQRWDRRSARQPRA